MDLLKMFEKTPVQGRPSLIRKTLDKFIREILGKEDEGSLDFDMNFAEIGMDSIAAVKLNRMINDSLGNKFQLASVEIFDNPTINQLAKVIEGKLNEK